MHHKLTVTMLEQILQGRSGRGQKKANTMPGKTVEEIKEAILSTRGQTNDRCGEEPDFKVGDVVFQEGSKFPAYVVVETFPRQRVGNLKENTRVNYADMIVRGVSNAHADAPAFAVEFAADSRAITTGENKEGEYTLINEWRLVTPKIIAVVNEHIEAELAKAAQGHGDGLGFLGEA